MTTEPAHSADTVRFPSDVCQRQIAALKREIAEAQHKLAIWERRLIDGEAP